MLKYIDQKMLVTGLAVIVIGFFLQKWLTKKVKNSDGSESHFVGHSSVGYF